MDFGNIQNPDKLGTGSLAQRKPRRTVISEEDMSVNETAAVSHKTVAVYLSSVAQVGHMITGKAGPRLPGGERWGAGGEVSFPPPAASVSSGVPVCRRTYGLTNSCRTGKIDSSFLTSNSKQTFKALADNWQDALNIVVKTYLVGFPASLPTILIPRLSEVSGPRFLLRQESNHADFK
ncbi:hypothetical protein J6590_015828 [Homalodisca vitripennis]|nr:hypothetical protein J6590_015828 [Homalodisca vitripennis]